MPNKPYRKNAPPFEIKRDQMKRLMKRLASRNLNGISRTAARSATSPIPPAEEWFAPQWLSEAVRYSIPAECYEFQARRTPPRRACYKPVPYSYTSLRGVVNWIVSVDPDVKFCIQRHGAGNKKLFLYANPPMYSGADLLSPSSNVLQELSLDPLGILSVNLNKDNQIVIVDLDPVETPDQDTPIKPNPFEAVLLRSLPELGVITDKPSGIDESVPIVVQTPRGLHLIYKKDKDMKPKPTAVRNQLTRIGIQAEIIDRGLCAVMGLNYRLLTPYSGQKSLPYIPVPLWPVNKAVKNPLSLDTLVPKGQRYNSILAGIQTGQLVYFNEAPLVNYFHSYMCDGEIEPPQLKYLMDLAKREWAKTPVGKSMGQGTLPTTYPAEVQEKLSLMSPVTSFQGHIQSLYLSIRQTPNFSERVSFDLAEKARQTIGSGSFRLLAQTLSIRVLMAVYQVAQGAQLGTALAASVLFAGNQKMLIYDQESSEYLFYDNTRGFWKTIPDSLVKDIIRELSDSVIPGYAYTLLQRQNLLAEVTDRITQTSWGKEFSGFAFDNGTKLLGYPQLQEWNPDFEIRTGLPFPYAADLQFSATTTKYLDNLVGKNPTSVHMLRTFLFKALYKIGTPTHFLMVQGPPSSGKSLLFRYIEFLFGNDSVYAANVVRFESEFAFSGCSSALRFIIFEDADQTNKMVPRLLSFLKEKSTSPELKINLKFQNKERKISQVCYGLLVNQFLNYMGIQEALERRQIVLRTLPVPSEKINPGLYQDLVNDSPAVISWLERTPAIFTELLRYSATLNYMSESSNFRYNPVADFLNEVRDRLFLTPGYHTIMTGIEASKWRKNAEVAPALYDEYRQYMAGQGQTDEQSGTVNDFTNVISELSRSVFLLAPDPDGNFTGTRPIPGTESVKRVVWFNVSFVPPEKVPEMRERFEALDFKLPIGIAALSLLPQHTVENAWNIADIDPGVSIHQHYPEMWLKALFFAVKKGPSPEIIQSVTMQQARVAEKIVYMARKKEAIQSAWEEATGQPAESTVDVDLSDLPQDTELETSPGVFALGPSSNVQTELKMYDLSGKQTISPDSIPQTLPSEGYALEFYQYVWGKAQAAAATPDSIAETVADQEAGESVRYVSRNAYRKLAKLWLVGNTWREPVSYFMTTRSSWDTVRMENDKLAGTAAIPIEFVFNKEGNTIIDILVDDDALPGETAEPEPTVANLNAPEILADNYAPIPQLDNETEEVTSDDLETSISEESSPDNLLPEPQPDTSHQPFASASETSTPSEGPNPEFQSALTQKIPKQKISKIGTPQKRTVTEKLEQMRALKLKLASVANQVSASPGFESMTIPENWYDVVYEAGVELYCFNKSTTTVRASFADEGWHVLLGPIFEGTDPFVLEIAQYARTHNICGNFQTVLRNAIGALVLGPFKQALSGGLLNPFKRKHKQNTGFFQEMSGYDWQIDNLNKNSWTQEFPGARQGEQYRKCFGQWTEHDNTPELLNHLFNPFVLKGIMVCAFFINVMELSNNLVKFSEKTGSQNRTFSWKTIKDIQLFAVQYSGEPTTKDPGRLNVKGTSYTTLRRDLRELVVHPLLTVFSQNSEYCFVIKDLKGAHSAFQAALLKQGTPLLFSFYQKPNPDIWKEWFQLSKDPQTGNPSMSSEDKPLLKICYYAALNGGSINNFSSCERHLKKSIRETNPLYSRIPGFINAFLKHPITNELLKVGEYWKSLNGRIYVPTRLEPVYRVMDDKQSQTLNTAKLAIKPELSSKYLSKPGDPQPHKLPSLYFTSLEVIFMARLVGNLVATGKFLPVQGIHDGFLFITTQSEVNCLESQTIDEDLTEYAIQVLGIPLSLSTTVIEKEEDWVAVFDREESNLDSFV